MSDLPIFYSFRRCPYAMRARLALLASEISVELREIKLKEKPEAFLAVSKSATVPCLVLPDGSALDESYDIMVWALKQNDPFDWLPMDGAEGDATDALVEQADGPFKTNLDGYKYAQLDADKLPVADGLAHRSYGLEFLVKLDAQLAASAGLVADRLTLADVAIAPFVRQFANVNREWFDTQPLPHLHDWLAAFLSSDLFAATMFKFDVWQPGEAGIVYPPR
ncbi:glutathione S-transferase [Pseudahrensia aquimaris]|uniref:Glutathione S-transferase n=1 Tax=Pseudahrensia aquimaris TaxID=744461 RepID=A0ABW3FK10_9HYPH